MSEKAENLSMLHHTQPMPRIEVPEESGLDESDGSTKSKLQRKLSLPVQLTSYARSADIRRSSDTSRNLGYYGDYLTPVQDKGKKGNISKKHSFDFEKTGIFVPEVYLEAAMSPGSLREELKQIQTIEEKWDAIEDTSDRFQYLEGFKMDKKWV